MSHDPLFDVAREVVDAGVPEELRRLPPMWVVYDHPRDHPGHWVARMWMGPDWASSVVIICQSLEVLRNRLEQQWGLTRLERHPDDDPVIVEVWI